MDQPKGKKPLIQIPSYQEVFGGGGAAPVATPSYNPPPPPPQSFSQAFSALKDSEFYTPPPQPPPKPSHESPPPQSSSSSTSVAAPAAAGQNRNAILVSHRQKGNPLLKHIRNVKWVFADIVCDYLVGQSSCALYLSLRYHLLHPDYLYYRIRELQKNFKLRVVLCHVDVEDVVKPLLEVTRTAMLHDCTLLCGWSLEECGRYLETIKVYENKPADSIREQMDTDYLSRLTQALTSVRHVNKTDAVTLGTAFGSLSGIMDASLEDLARCPGIGERKVKRLYDTFHEPFRRVSKRAAVAVPETPTKDASAEEIFATKDGVEVEGEKANTSKNEKESGPSVRSALTAAFAKYSDRVAKCDRKGEPVEQGESIFRQGRQARQEGETEQGESIFRQGRQALQEGETGRAGGVHIQTGSPSVTGRGNRSGRGSPYSDRVAKRDRKGKSVEQEESSSSVASKELNTNRGN